MSVDYEALTIDPVCNVDIDVLGPQGRQWQGERDVRGLPFRIGDDVAQVALFGGDGHCDPQTLGIGRTARTPTFAHTSPIYVASGGEEWSMWSDATAQYMLTLVDGSLKYIRHRSTQYPDGHASHHHGEADHLAYLERPFHEAREAIHRRMHQLGLPH